MDLLLAVIFAVGAVICHQRPERSFFLDGHQLPVCARCTGLYLSGAIGLLGCIGYLLILVRLDQSIYSTADLPAITDYPVLVQIPRLPRRSTAWIAGANGKMLPDKGA